MTTASVPSEPRRSVSAWASSPSSPSVDVHSARPPRASPETVHVAQGLSNAEIAARLFVGVETVKTHVARVLTKVDARDRTQAVIRAYETGFITAGEA